LKSRATLNRIDRRGKHADKSNVPLDNRARAPSRARKLSTIFVDKCVHSFYKRTVSRFFESVFCFAIKKCAPV